MANKKLDDCYFYYYSTCYKGDDCAFRHEENALGCETVCPNWKAGTCQNVHCQFRHMLLKKNRKAIPCFWESQPNGCRKPHCPFLHTKGKPEGSSQDSPNVSGGLNQSSGGNVLSKNIPVDTSKMSHEGLRRPNPSTLENDLNFSSPPVDPLVVKFEEESDNELDIPSPCKSVAVNSQKKSWVKTLEEIRLEKIQELSAAFYSFTEGIEAQNPETRKPGNVMMDVLNKAIVTNLGVLTKTTNRSLVKSTVKRKASVDSDDLGFRVLTLAEIRQKRQKKNQVQEPDSTSGDKMPSNDSPSQECSSQGAERSALVPGRQKMTNIKNTIQSSATIVSTVQVSQANSTDIRSPEHVQVDVPQEENIPQKLSLLDVSKSTNIDVHQKSMSGKMSNPLPHESSPHKCVEGRKVNVPKKPKEINVVSPLQQSSTVLGVDACRIQKPINIISPLMCQDVPQLNQNVDGPLMNQQKVDVELMNQQKVDAPSRNTQKVDVVLKSQQNVDAPSRNQQNVDSGSKHQKNVDVTPPNRQILDVPPKNKPIRLKRNMRRDTQEESPDLGASSAKRSKATEDGQTSLSRSEDAEQGNSNLSEITSNTGEMDTDDILNGIDELLGN
ncbi:hypothetical protein LSTR_LSTR009396 [Laodelphax striatellus]|uniref:C3H1-type domain-containing protein n=1 Tax=Laodelphax striatellus TaxID=195883 RepID=A0A482WH42_LAOST|nr:hypothetical protein LSTR_LSTR009396 [Laodelphax striatellus]